MAYLELFQRVSHHVKAQGVKVIFKRGKSLSPSVIKRAQAKALIPIPQSMAEFYAEVGDGLAFGWTAKGDTAPFASHDFPKLAAITLQSFDKINWRSEWNDANDFRYTKDPKLAKRTAMRMRKWMPIHDEGNGDRFCLDTAIDPSRVVFDQHDWLDGGTGANGHLLGRSLLDFYTAWSKVCFQRPRSLWWPSVLKKAGGGVNWASEEFQEPFRLLRDAR